jgi:hypothetical protein
MEAGCDGWVVAADKFDGSCYTPKWAVREREIFDTRQVSLHLEGIAVVV